MYKTRIQITVLIALLLSIVGGVALYVFLIHPILKKAKEAAEEANVPTQKKVRVSVIIPAALEEVALLPGDTAPIDEIIVSSEANGVVEEVLFGEGAYVEEGAVLIRVDSANLKLVVDAAKAAFDLAQSTYDRQYRLYAESEPRVISRQQLEAVQASRDLRKAEYERAKLQYEKSEVKSPVAGFIEEMFPEKGEFTTYGSRVARIVNTLKLKITSNVPERVVKNLSVYKDGGDNTGSIVLFSPATDEDFTRKAYITRIAKTADQATKTFLVEAEYNNSDGGVRAGVTAKLKFVTKIHTDAVMVPISALSHSRKGISVFVLEENSGGTGFVARERLISYGAIQKDTIQITEGLAPGDKLIVMGHRNVSDGESVVLETTESLAE